MKFKRLIPTMAAALLLSACQKNPDSSIVKNKDLDQMIDQAENNKNGSTNLSDLAVNYQDYKTTLKDDQLYVTVNVDAKVEVPGSSQMSIFRVKQKNIDQSLLDKVKKELVRDIVLYDGKAISIKTRSSIEQEIQSLKEQITSTKADTDSYDQESIQTMVGEYQEIINTLQREYESAPAEIKWSEYPSDGKLKSITDLCKGKSGDSYYTGIKELNPDGDYYYGVSDGKNGQYTSLFAQNNKNYGNCLRYGRDNNNYVRITSVVAGNKCNLGLWSLQDGISQDSLLVEGVNPEEFEEYENSTLTVSQEDAKKQADALIQSLGLTDFLCESGGQYGEVVAEGPSPDNGKWGYRKVNILNYMRNIDGVFVDNENGSKLTDGWKGSEYVKKMWDGESITVIVNDDGIIGFYYNAPIELTETVVEKSSMKTFDEIKDIFEQMVLVANARKEPEDAVSMNVSRVILRYTRISEQDRFDTGLLVPVWDFMGTVTEASGKLPEQQEACIMTINAIDGSIIDRELGY